MDNDSLQSALATALRMLPEELRPKLGQIILLIVQSMPRIEPLIPKILPVLMPHIQALAMEWSMGMLDSKSLETAIEGAFKEIGIEVPGSNG